MPRLTRALVALVALAAVLPVLAGCGFLDDMAHPDEREPATSGRGTAAPATATPPRDPPPVVVAAAHLDGGGPLTVSVGPVVTGLAGHLTVTPGPATPAGIGDVGVFFEPSTGEDAYCHGYPPLPTGDTFWAHGSSGHITGYVVLDQAVTPATPQGRAEVFPTLQARIDTLRLKDPDTGAERPLALGAVRVGSPCPDDSAALCVPLG